MLQYSFLGEFDLLRNARQDVRLKDWAQPQNRAVMEKHFKFMRAKEEISRLNIEVRRLAQWIADEPLSYSLASAGGSYALGLEIQTRWEYQCAVNQELSHQLDRIQSLRGYSGSALAEVVSKPDDEWEDTDGEDGEAEDALEDARLVTEALDD